jgi:hypothetical protein
MIITFERPFTKQILKAFDKSVDADGYITDNQGGHRVLSNEGEEIKLTEFAGILPGSQVFIKSDIVSLIKYLEWSRENGS